MRGVHLYQTNLIPNQSFVKIVIFRSVQSSNIFLFLCIFRSFYHILAYFLKFIFSIYFFLEPRRLKNVILFLLVKSCQDYSQLLNVKRSLVGFPKRRVETLFFCL